MLKFAAKLADLIMISTTICYVTFFRYLSTLPIYFQIISIYQLEV